MTWEELGIKDYKEYLLSDHWRSLKTKLLTKGDAHCYICKTINNLLLHHVTYKNLGAEKLNRDVYILCSDSASRVGCHTKAHFWTPLRLKVPLRINWLLLSMRLRKLQYYTQKGEFRLLGLWSLTIGIVLVINIIMFLTQKLLKITWKILTIAMP